MFGFITSWALAPPAAPPQRTRARFRKSSPDTYTSWSSRSSRLVPPHHMPAAMGPAAPPDGKAQTSFYTALYAPYADPLPPVPPRLPKTYQSKCKATVNWTVRPSPDMSSSDEEDDDEMYAPEISDDVLERPAYEPVFKWAWTKNQPLSDAVLLRSIHVDATSATSIMRGKIDGTELTYICKSWSRAARPLWRGFYSELKLFSSPNYLRGLQGCIVPNLINLYDSPSSISFLMELPHSSFWMEASADMPTVLKKVVIQAYVILHNRGILHGEPELRNMLIGGDGRVTLINFHAARTREPVPELGLLQAEKRDFALELRQVMFKLDYAGARARENAKVERFLALEKRNKRRRARYEPEEKPMLEELAERPVAPDVWKSRWTNALNVKPRRHVVPGQAPDELQRCIDAFEAVVRRLEEFDAKDMTSPLIRLNMGSSAPPLSVSGPSSSSAPPSSRKRKASHALGDVELPYKRLRGDEGSDKSALPSQSYERSSVTYDTGTSHALLRAQPTQTVEPKADAARDFAYEAYDGPRGYYVPHPPTEVLSNSMRIVHIRNTNAIACGQQGLPYYRLDRWHLRAPAFKRSVPKGMHVSLGALKRQRAAAEHPGTPDEWRKAKKQRFEEDRAAALAEDRAVRFDDNVSFRDPPREADYERGILDRTLVASLPPSVRATDDSAPRSILKPTRPVKGVTYDLSLWPCRSRGAADESDSDELSGPPEPLVPASLRTAAAGPSSRPDAPEESGRALPYTGVVGEGGESLTGRYDKSIADGTDGAALSGTPPAFSLALTDETLTAPAPWTVPYAGAGASMVRDTDASTPTHDSRCRPRSRGSHWAGSSSRHAPLAEEHDQEEMEVEAFLFSDE